MARMAKMVNFRKSSKNCKFWIQYEIMCETDKRNKSNMGGRKAIRIDDEEWDEMIILRDEVMILIYE